MKFGSVCSGIEAASVAFGPLGWRAAWFSEIDPFASAVLAHHYPGVRNLGDMRSLPKLIAERAVEAPDIVCGGTPCQAFSVAGLRESLDDARGSLSLIFCEIADATDSVRRGSGQPAAVILWENVPGVLSTRDNAFGCMLAGLCGDDAALEPGPRPAAGRSTAHWRWDKAAGEHSPRWPDAGAAAGPARTVAWRILDAQFFGLAQRRRRVFVVASARDGFDPVAVLLEFEGLRRDSAPSRQTGQEVAGSLGAGSKRSGGRIGRREAAANQVLAIEVAGTLSANQGPNANGFGDFLSNQSVDAGHVLAVSQAAYGGNNQSGPIDVSTAMSAKGGTGRSDFESETFIVFDTTQITHPANRSNPQPGDPVHTLPSDGHPPAIAFTGDGVVADPIGTSEARTYTNEGKTFRLHNCVAQAPDSGWRVRRLTPVECARLQGFPDRYLDIVHLRKPAKDGPKYKALGNSWAVANVAWIGRRIQAELLRGGPA